MENISEKLSKLNEELEEKKTKLLFNKEITLPEKIRNLNSLYKQYFKDVSKIRMGENIEHNTINK